VILEADQVLATVLKAKVIGNSALGVAFDPPNKAWITALKGPVVNFFLFDIRENTHRRDVMYEEVRNDEGVVVARRPPPLRYDLHYTVTVWAPKVLAEHKILAATLRCFSGMEIVPRDMLPPALAELPYEVLLVTGAGSKRSMFLNLGGELKVGFELTLTVPMPGLPDRPAAPAVRQQPEIKVNPVPGADPARTVAATETVAAKPVDEKEKQGSTS
jgi:hypothetical protein